jgi:hypothetical protein
MLSPVLGRSNDWSFDTCRSCWENSGYTLGRMRYEIVFASEAVEENALTAAIRSKVKRDLETHLRYESTKVGRSRIKRLRVFYVPNTDSERMRFECSMTSVARMRKSWRSYRSRRPRNGWKGSSG